MKRYKTVYDRFCVKAAIVKLATQVTEIIEEKGAENCVLLTVLDGGAYLSHKIIDRLGQDMLKELATSNIKVSSYKGEFQEQVRYEYLPHIDCRHKTVIVIDDFCDSGKTLENIQYILNHDYYVDEIVFVTLLSRKHHKLHLNNKTKLLYSIEDDTDNFYYGCGMDEDGKGRYMDSIITKINK